MADNDLGSFLGTGWGFPPTFKRSNRGVSMVSDLEDIKESITILLSTILGERVMRHDFGANLHELVFENMNLTSKTIATSTIKTALVLYEPRVKVNSVELEEGVNDSLQGLMNIRVDYTVRAVNSRFNLVFPFYLTEGGQLL